ncbi:MAG: dephospho-CoA kinase [Bdellovibrionales bacterium]|nr:dephospho-CoA kinase [Bdellovibrionales bacterium]
MIWIGLTGGIGTGKSTAAQYLRRVGFHVLDADDIVHKSMGPNGDLVSSIVDQFGPKVRSIDGSIDRKKLGDVAFQNKEDLLKLEKIVHPYVQKKVQEIRKGLVKSEAIAFYDVPLLFEKNLESQFDETWLIYAPVEIQRSRIQIRNGWSLEEIEKRIQSQMPIDEKRKKATVIFDNSKTEKDLFQLMDRELQRLKNHQPQT